MAAVNKMVDRVAVAQGTKTHPEQVYRVKAIMAALALRMLVVAAVALVQLAKLV